MTMKTKKTLQHIAAVAVVLLALLVFVVPVSAENVVELEVAETSPSNTLLRPVGSADPGQTFQEIVGGLEEGDVVILPSGILNVTPSGYIVVNPCFNFVIEGAADGTTVINVINKGSYRFFQLNHRVPLNPENEVTVTFKNLTIDGNNIDGFSCFVVTTAQITLNLENVAIKNFTGDAISAWANAALSDGSYSTKENLAGIVINLKSVETDNNRALIHFDIAPWYDHTSSPESADFKAVVNGYSFVHLNYDETCSFNDKSTGNFVYEDENENLCPLTYTYKSDPTQMILFEGNMRVNDNPDISLSLAEAKIGDTHYGTLEDAVAAANENADATTIKVLKNCALDSAVTITTEIIITADSPVTITTNGVIDAFTAGTGGKLTLGQNITVESNSRGMLWMINGGMITIDGATVKSTSTEHCVAGVNAESALLVKSGVLESTGNSVICVVGENAVTTIEGGDVKTTCSDPRWCAVFARGGGLAEVTGNGIVSAAAGYGLVAVTNGQVKVSGGTVNNGVLAHENTGANAVITGGTINGNVTTEEGASMSITGGTINGHINEEEGSEILISGGTFSADPSAYVAAKYAAVPYEGKYLVQKMVEVTYGGSSTTEPEEPEQPEEPIEPTPETPAAPGEVVSSTEVTDGGDVTFETPAGEDGTAPAAADDEVKGVVLPTGTEGTVEFVPVSEQPAPAGQEENTKRVFEINVPSYKKGEASVIKFQMTVAEIEADGKTAADVALWHYDEETGEWTKLVTSFIIKDGIVYFEAITNDFSPFAIVYADEPAEELPTDQPEEPTETPASPAPVLAVIAALGAAVVLRRK